MPLPEHIRALLEEAGGDWHLPGEDDTECEGSRYHSPTPLLVMAVPLVPVEWPSGAGQYSPLVRLCGTCRDNLGVLQQILFALNGEISWQARREFGNTIRALGDKGWRLYKERGEGA